MTMPYGKTLELRGLDTLRWIARWKNPPAMRETRPRDRSLAGKARIRARKAANKAGA
jgi:hypothetical protein